MLHPILFCFFSNYLVICPPPPLSQFFQAAISTHSLPTSLSYTVLYEERELSLVWINLGTSSDLNEYERYTHDIFYIRGFLQLCKRNFENTLL